MRTSRLLNKLQDVYDDSIVLGKLSFFLIFLLEGEASFVDFGIDILFVDFGISYFIP